MAAAMMVIDSDSRSPKGPCAVHHQTYMIHSRALVTFASLTSFVVADPAPQVNPENITTFESGTPASAADMNTTLGELITVINQQATLIDSLRADLDSLETEVDQNTASISSSSLVAGRTYKLVEVGVTLERQYGPLVDGDRTESLLTHVRDNVISMTFSNNGTVSLSTNAKEFEGIVTQSPVDDIDQVNVALDGPISDGESLGSSYAQNGNAISAFGMTFYASNDGSSLVANVRDSENQANGDKRITGGVICGVEVN